MSILGTDAYRFALASALATGRTSLSLISAYITVPGIKWVLERLNPSVSSCRVLARWNCGDLVSGASELEAYDVVRGRGASFFVLPDVHAKVVIIDEQDLFVGSANITGAGLRLVPGGNREIGVRLVASADNAKVIDAMFAEATEVTPELYEEFRENLKSFKPLAAPQPTQSWPDGFSQKLRKGPQRLWVTELLWCENPNAFRNAAEGDADRDLAVQHDLTLLGIDTDPLNDIETDALRQGFLESRVWRWLVAKLLQADGHELYFGDLSANLHDALLDDPKPYRQDVKGLLMNLIKWGEEFGQSSIVIDRPNYSQRLRLTRE